MLWVWIIVAAAVGGLVMLAFFAVWLWRKLRALGTALADLGRQLEGALALLDMVELEPRRPESVH
ncbi:MAG: hypothetical protein QM708_01730 [Propioniciclava sp.]|uniref:hypothetical protein n=1 Tax=Propioniciclava sp. TaxID=2038686 RepID=UPI0039E71F27